jgi:surface antigen
MSGPNGSSGTFGNANNWNNNGENTGFMVGTSPRVGAMAVWEANEDGASSAGHVAWVEAVNGNGTIDISEYNFNFGDGNYNSRTVSTNSLPSSYLYLCGVDNVIIEGETVSNGQTFNCTGENSINRGSALT